MLRKRIVLQQVYMLLLTRHIDVAANCTREVVKRLPLVSSAAAEAALARHHHAHRRPRGGAAWWRYHHFGMAGPYMFDARYHPICGISGKQ